MSLSKTCKFRSQESDLHSYKANDVKSPIVVDNSSNEGSLDQISAQYNILLMIRKLTTKRIKSTNSET